MPIAPCSAATVTGSVWDSETGGSASATLVDERLENDPMP